MKVLEEFDISKYITAADVAAAVAAGIMAYITNRAKADDQQQSQAGDATGQGAPTAEQPVAPTEPQTPVATAPIAKPSPKLNYGFDNFTSPEQMILSNQNYENAVSKAVGSLNLPRSSATRLSNALWRIRNEYTGDNEVLHKLLDDPGKLRILSANLPRSGYSLEGQVFLKHLVKQLNSGADLVQAARMAHRATGY